MGKPPRPRWRIIDGATVIDEVEARNNSEAKRVAIRRMREAGIDDAEILKRFDRIKAERIDEKA